MMIAFRVLVGLGETSYATISPSLISDSYAPTKRNNALTIFYVTIPVGAALGTIIGGIIAAKWGRRHAFIWACVPGLFLALVLLPFAEPKRGQTEGKTAQAAKRPSVRDIVNLIRIPDYVLVVLGYTAYGACQLALVWQEPARYALAIWRLSAGWRSDWFLARTICSAASRSLVLRL